MFELAAATVLAALAADQLSAEHSVPGALLVAKWPDGTSLYRVYGHGIKMQAMRNLLPKALVHDLPLDRWNRTFIFTDGDIRNKKFLAIAFIRFDRTTLLCDIEDEAFEHREHRLRFVGAGHEVESQILDLKATLTGTIYWPGHEKHSMQRINRKKAVEPPRFDLRGKALWFLLAYLKTPPENLPEATWLRIGLPIWLDPRRRISNYRLEPGKRVAQEGPINVRQHHLHEKYQRMVRAWQTHTGYAEDIAELEREKMDLELESETADDEHADEISDRIIDIEMDVKTGRDYRTDSKNDFLKAVGSYLDHIHYIEHRNRNARFQKRTSGDFASIDEDIHFALVDNAVTSGHRRHVLYCELSMDLHDPSIEGWLEDDDEASLWIRQREADERHYGPLPPLLTIHSDQLKAWPIDEHFNVTEGWFEGVEQAGVYADPDVYVPWIRAHIEVPTTVHTKLDWRRAALLRRLPTVLRFDIDLSGKD
jgi:hypothetical protein